MTYYTAADFDATWRTLDGEARGEPVEGQIAVLYTMLNRAALAKLHLTRMFGDGSLAGVCLAPWQYSCQNPGPARDHLNAVKAGQDPETLRVIATTAGVLLGDIPPPNAAWWSPRITHYHVRTDPFPPGWTPHPKPDTWAAPPPTGIIGRHAFYSEDVVP